MNKINSTLSNLLSRVFFPQTCVGCMERGTALCTKCSMKIKRAFPPPHREHYALYAYKDPIIKKLLWQAKYHHDTQALEILIQKSIGDIAHILSEVVLSETPIRIIIIPLPTSKSRKKIRGYDVPVLMAKKIAHVLGFTYAPFLKKIRETIPQSKTHSREARLINAHKTLTFVPKTTLPQDALYVIIDDIITTGASASEAQRALREHNLSSIVIALAHGS